MSAAPSTAVPPASAASTVLPILAAISVAHMINDTLQSLLQATYPMLKENYALTFAQIGFITLAFQLTASVLQPLVGLYTDRRPLPYSLTLGMGLTLTGLLLLATAHSYGVILLAAGLVGTGSSIFHPESSRVARMAAGNRPGFAQAFFQVGGNTGTAIGPLLAAFIVIPNGQESIAFFGVLALAGMVLLFVVGTWYKANPGRVKARSNTVADVDRIPRAVVARSILILIALMFSKFVYTASLGNYFTFYLIAQFGVGVQTAQLLLFVFLGATAVGTIAGGAFSDRFGLKRVIWGSILGVLPFTLVLPYADLMWTTILAAVIGFILASAFSAIVVYAQELMPGHVGLVAGLFFGLAFGLGGIGAAAIGALADATSIQFVFKVCAFLPAIGLLTAFLPNIDRRRG
ncbi:MAG: MFS transporter [Labrys sp. (in: a-proteobacteria)]